MNKFKDLSPRYAAKRQYVVDDFHGVKVADPYRWLEDDEADDVAEWSNHHRKYFEDYINNFPIKNELNKRITELWAYEKCNAPKYVNGKYYTWRNNGLQNQFVLYVSDKLDKTGKIVLDPNTLSDDGTVAIGSYAFSKNGRYFAYGLSNKGSDWQSIHILNLETGENMPDILHHMKFSGITWMPDDSGFFYTRYPEPAEAVMEREALFSMVCLHRLGTEQSEDLVIHKNDGEPNWDFRVEADEEKKWLFMSVTNSTLPVNQLHYKPIADLSAPWEIISDNFDEGYFPIGVADDIVYIHTLKDAPFGKIISLVLTGSDKGKSVEIIPEKNKTLEYAYIAGGKILINYCEHAVSTLFLYDIDGGGEIEIPMPAPGTVYSISASQSRNEMFFQFGSYLYPAAVLRYDIATGEMSTQFMPKISFDFGAYESKQVFYTSKDGTKVPLFITKRKDIELNGKNPTLLYGYGGYNVSMTPSFSVNTITWLEQGGIYAVACCRGGNEYGEAWHRAGMLESKQNTFDDFIAAAEYLIDEGYTGKEHIGIQGGSNGGLLTGACMVQRPDLFGAVVVGVPVLDMLRFHLFTAGRYWTGEYGDVTIEEHFNFMYRYSPLHNVKINTTYPPTLIMTADTDDRVVPMHARKFCATLQAADAGENPILIRIEKSAGHGAGKPTAKIIESSADVLTFLLANLK
ncbi:MAG: prolyl oligopeptidase family serine peptidase [Defluviitaleaceae bacterium]|nr:prolyl oligopeptidase family serine peptidase [Defluviitaleaceae bacterium]